MTKASACSPQVTLLGWRIAGQRDRALRPGVPAAHGTHVSAITATPNKPKQTQPTYLQRLTPPPPPPEIAIPPSATATVRPGSLHPIRFREPIPFPELNKCQPPPRSPPTRPTRSAPPVPPAKPVKPPPPATISSSV